MSAPALRLAAEPVEEERPQSAAELRRHLRDVLVEEMGADASWRLLLERAVRGEPLGAAECFRACVRRTPGDVLWLVDQIVAAVRREEGMGES